MSPSSPRYPIRLLPGPVPARFVTAAVAAVAVVTAVIATVVAGSAVAVGAQDPLDCSTPVVDMSGLLDLATVEAAVAEVDRSRIGLDAAVLVRVWDVVPGADLAAAVDEVVAVCVGDPDVGIAADAVVLGLSVRDGLSDVLVGGSWTGVVPSADRLRTEVIGPHLAEGDITGGLVAALDALANGVAALPPATDATTAIGDQEAGDPVGPEDDTDDNSGEAAGDGSPTIGSEPVPGSGPEPATEPEPAPESSASGSGSAFGVVLGVLGLGGCAGAAVLVMRWRSLARGRDRLRGRAQPALGRLRVLRERHRQLLGQADVWYRIGAGTTRTEVGDGIRRVKAAGNETDRTAGLLYRVMPEGVDEVGRGQLDEAGDRVAELLRAVAAHAGALDDLAALGAHLDHLEVALPAKAEMLAHDLPDVRKLANQRVDEGWSVDSVRERLTAIQTTVGEVKEAESLLEVDLLDLSDRLERAEATLFSVDHELQHLPDRPGSLERWNDRLLEAADHELGRADELRRQLAGAAVVHASDSWTWAADRLERAIEAIERADVGQERTLDVLVPDQRFDEAGRALEEAGLELMVADDLLDQLDDLLADLERARVEAPKAVERVDHALEVLAATVARHHGEVSPQLVARQAELAPVVSGLKVELGRPKPNYLQVVEAAEHTDRVIDELLVEADEQHRRAEALQRELDRQVARAERALARTRRSLGWQLLPSADGSALDRLEAELCALPDDLEAGANAAADIADAALRLQEQIIARRRRHGAAVTVGAGPPAMGRGWNMGGSARRSGSTGSRPGTRSSGGRSFGGRRRSSGGRSLGSGRSTGRF